MKTNVSAQAKRLLASFALAAAPLGAATQTVTLSVPGMIRATENAGYPSTAVR